MPKHTNTAVLKAVQDMLAHKQQHGTEANVQADVVAIMRSLNVGTIESQYQIGREQADIYLPNQRAFIECKAYPKARDPNQPQTRAIPESAKEQLDRYVIEERSRELMRIPGINPTESDANWTGIITDGWHWHVYTYRHEPNATAQLDWNNGGIEFTGVEAQALAARLVAILGSRSIGKNWIPSSPASLFSELKQDLDSIHQNSPRRGGVRQSIRTNKALWLDMMEASGMVPTEPTEIDLVPEEPTAQDRLFVSHTFLISIARLVSHTLAALPGKGVQAAIENGFASWLCSFPRGKNWLDQLWQLVDAYDWKRTRSDVLRDLYHQYVSPKDRKVFGEFYTPDWLAELMVRQVLDDDWIEHSIKAALEKRTDGIGVLDPACGSGTFLYHAARRILDSHSIQRYALVKQADIVAQLVNGVDIHPVAVEIARVNMERVLPAPPSEGASALRIYLGDALQVKSRNIFQPDGSMLMHTPKGKQVFFPRRFVRDSSFAENMRLLVESASMVNESLPFGIGHKDDRKDIEECHAALREVIKDEKNSVWTWYAINLAGPYLLAERKVDRIVANPPWVKLADIQVEERKRMMEALGVELRLQEGGKQAPHLDIASFFILRCRRIYMDDSMTHPAAWLVKKSALRSGQWRMFRSRHSDTLAQSVDLQKLQPFGGGDATRSCILFEHRPMSGHADAPRLEVELLSPARPSPHDNYGTARRSFTFVASPPPIPQEQSQYLEHADIAQGATIVPHVLVLVESHGRTRRRGWSRVITRKSTHEPWKEIEPLDGQVPTTWLRILCTSTDMLPYIALRHPPTAIIPVHEDVLHDTPAASCPFWGVLDDHYSAHCGRGRSTPKTLLDRINFRKSLSCQPLVPGRGRRLVLYPSSGDIMRAARTRAGEAVADSTLFHFVVRSETEAGFLTAILNARCLRRAFAESRESGRDFQLHPWRKVPIPIYDATNSNHRRLASLCSQAERIAVSSVSETVAEKPRLGQIGLSQAIRNAVYESKAGLEIEEIVAMLLPDQVG